MCIRDRFTDLRTNPRPSFAPDATAGYAISYERQYYTLPADLWAGCLLYTSRCV